MSKEYGKGSTEIPDKLLKDCIDCMLTLDTYKGRFSNDAREQIGKTWNELQEYLECSREEKSCPSCPDEELFIDKLEKRVGNLEKKSALKELKDDWIIPEMLSIDLQQRIAKLEEQVENIIEELNNE